MPRGDRTGPLGMGPLTGRRLGFCAGSKVPGYLNASYRREFWFKTTRLQACILACWNDPLVFLSSLSLI